jgi:chaperonin GroES
MKLKPLGDRVVVKPSENEEVTKAGIVLPDTVEKEKKEQGEVVSVGNGEKITKLGLKAGDVVMFGKYAGEDVTVDDVEYKVLEEKDVLAVIEK